MANIGHQKSSEAKKKRIMHSAAKLFLQNGYSKTKLSDITKDANVGVNTIAGLFGDKEGLLAELVKYVLDGQFSAAEQMLRGKTDDKLLFYAAETTLQLYISESSEYIRELYSMAYSLPKSTKIIQDTITVKLEAIFCEHLPDLDTKDFYELEIASGGIMRSFMSRPCDIYFTMERKVRRFLETTFHVYRVSDEKIREAVEFVSQIDYPTVARQTIDNMLKYLDSHT